LILLIIIIILSTFVVSVPDESSPESSGEPISSTHQEPFVENEENEKEESPESIEPDKTISGYSTSAEVDTSFAFPNPESLEKRFPIGKQSEILLGFSNTGDSELTITQIKGFIVAPLDWSYFIQNLTTYLYNLTILPDETNTVLYKFSPAKNLDEREYGILFDVIYKNKGNETFGATFYNETVILYFADENLSTRNATSYITLAGIVGFILFFLFYVLGSERSTPLGSSFSFSSSSKIDESRYKSTLIDEKTNEEEVYENIDPALVNRMKKTKESKKKPKTPN
jgi:translocon-associated protein subunit alpha